MAQQKNTPTGYSKRPSREAAAEEQAAGYPQGYVEDLSKTRTKLEDFFSILLRLRGC